MKKRLLSFIVALTCLLMPVLTSCSDGEDYVPMAKVKAMTITLYGIKGEGTTDEAIKAVQDELNEYTEGNLNTRVLLRLYTEDEYYAKLDEAFVKAEEYKNNKKNNSSSVSQEPATSDEKTSKYEMVYPTEQGTQVDIFMVRGYDMFNKYASEGLATSVTIGEKSSLISKYISDRYIDLTTVGGTPTTGGLLDKGSIKGIPNNYVVGEYTYLLVNRELATKYYYAEKNLTTLAGLANFLNDASTKHKDYITLYNAPELNVNTFGNTLLGGVVTEDAHAYAQLDPSNLLGNEAYVDYLKHLNLFTSKEYITEGDAHALPENEKVAAAFIKGDASVPAQYGDDYLVIPYAKPVMQDLGTVFCVGKYASNASRCLEVISLLQTNVEYRNTFQYGVENVHYTVNDYTGIIEIVSDDYNMNPADTGNIFLLKENSLMDAATRALAADNWALAKVQYRDTVVNPYLKFSLTYYDENNIKESDGYKDAYDAALDAAIAEAKAEAEASGTNFDEKAFKEEFEENGAFVYEGTYTADIVSSIESASSQAYASLMAYKPGQTAVTFEAYAAQLAATLDENVFVKSFLDPEAPDSLASQYAKFCSTEKIAK